MSVLYLKIWNLLNIDFISLVSKSIADLPRIYVNNPALLPKSKGRKYVVSITKVLAYKKYFLLKLNSFRSFIYKKNQRWSWNGKKKSHNSEFMWSKRIKYY